MSINNKSVAIEIPVSLAEKLQKEAEKAGQKNLSEYVTYLLRGKSLLSAE